MMIFVLLTGVYLLMVAWQGNATQMLDFLMSQKGYLVWLVAIGIFYGLYQVKEIRPVVGPFAGLTLLAFFVNSAKSGNLTNEITGLEGMLGISSVPGTGSIIQGTSVTAPTTNNTTMA